MTLSLLADPAAHKDAAVLDPKGSSGREGQPARALAAPHADAIAGVIIERLNLTKADTLLDLGCGAGAVSQMLFDHVAGFLGVDRSPYLISMAQRNFARPGYSFTAASAAGFAATTRIPWRFTAVLCYGTIAFLSDGDVLAVLKALSVRFTRVRRILLSNLPNVDHVAALNHASFPSTSEMTDPHTPTGVWRSPAHIAHLAARTGWHVEPETGQPWEADTDYRFDVLLTRAGS